MKSLGMALVAVLLSVSAGYAANKSTNIAKEPFVANITKLSSYLQLNPYQAGEVAGINEYFIEMQKQSLRTKPEFQEEKMYQAVYGNLKLMKGVLTDEQYRKYVTLLNVTNNNNRLIGTNSLHLDAQVADLGK